MEEALASLPTHSEHCPEQGKWREGSQNCPVWIPCVVGMAGEGGEGGTLPDGLDPEVTHGPLKNPSREGASLRDLAIRLEEKVRMHNTPETPGPAEGQWTKPCPTGLFPQLSF